MRYAKSREYKTEYCDFKQTHSFWKRNIQHQGRYSGFAYDAMLAMSLALNSSIEVLAARNKSLENFTYEDQEMAQILKEAMFNVSFLGLSVGGRGVAFFLL